MQVIATTTALVKNDNGTAKYSKLSAILSIIDTHPSFRIGPNKESRDVNPLPLLAHTRT